LLGRSSVGADLAAVVLGVDDGDPAWADCDVVDVRGTAAGHPAVVQQLDLGAGEQLGEAGPGAFFAVGAGLPCSGALGFVDHPCEEDAQRAELLTCTVLSGDVSALVYAAGAGARDGGIGRSGVKNASEAGHDAPPSVPGGGRASGERGAADGAVIWTAQAKRPRSGAVAHEPVIGRSRTGPTGISGGSAAVARRPVGRRRSGGNKRVPNHVPNSAILTQCNLR